MGISEQEVHEIGEKKKLLEEIEEAKAQLQAPDPRVVTTIEDQNAPQEPSESNAHKEAENVINGDEMVTLDEINKEIENQLTSRRRRKRQFQTDPKRIWQTDIDYYVHYKFPSSLRGMLTEAMKWFNENTCFTMRQATTEATARQPYLIYMRGAWCQSYVGKVSTERQVVAMAEGCAGVGTIIHETLHALGFHHEQSRSDRDNWVRILFKNIKKGSQSNFSKEKTNNLRSPYVYGSLMAYRGKSFSISYHKQTIIANEQKHQRTMGFRVSGTFADARRVNAAYKCIDRCTSGPNCKNGGYRNPKKCNSCLCPQAFTGNDCSLLHPAIDPTGSNYGCGGVIDVPSTETRYVLTAKSGGQRKPHYCFTQFTASPGNVLQIRMAPEDGDWMSCSGGCNFGFIELNGGQKSTVGRDYGLPGYRDCCVTQLERRPIMFDTDTVIATMFARSATKQASPWEPSTMDAQVTVYAKAMRSDGGRPTSTVHPPETTTVRPTTASPQSLTTTTIRAATTTTMSHKCQTNVAIASANICYKNCEYYRTRFGHSYFMKCRNDCVDRYC